MAPTEITFLGSGDVFGTDGRLQTCIHVETDSSAFLIDCGATAMPAMKRYGVDPNEIDAIFISHLHGDHFGGLTYFTLDAQHSSKRTDPITIVGPPGIEARTRKAMDAMVPGLWDVDQRFDMRFREHEHGVDMTVGDITLTPYEVIHACGAPPFALRFEYDGEAIGYSGDTEWTDSLIDAARDTDLFISEAYFYEREVPYHLSYRTLMSHRDELTCDRLVLTHMNWDMLGRRDEVDVECAEDGLTLTV